MKKKALIGLIIYAALILVCVVAVYVIPSVRGMLVSTYLAEPGEINLTDEVDAFIVRDETVYVAKTAKDVVRLADDGKLVKAGTQVVEFNGEGVPSSADVYSHILASLGKKIKRTESGKTKIAGYVSYSVDGVEGRLKTENIKDINHSMLDDLIGFELKGTVKGACAADDPVFKIVRNGKYYIVFYLGKKDAKRYIEGDTVSLLVNEKELNAKVFSVNKEGTEYRIVLKCGILFDGYLTDRKIHANITTSGAKGLKLKTASIIKKDGIQGVLVRNKVGTNVFKPICVKADDGENCIVYQDIFMDEQSNYVETISIYDEIIEEPSKTEIEEAE